MFKYSTTVKLRAFISENVGVVCSSPVIKVEKGDWRTTESAMQIYCTRILTYKLNLISPQFYFGR